MPDNITLSIELAHLQPATHQALGTWEIVENILFFAIQLNIPRLANTVHKLRLHPSAHQFPANRVEHLPFENQKRHKAVYIPPVKDPSLDLRRVSRRWKDAFDNSPRLHNRMNLQKYSIRILHAQRTALGIHLHESFIRLELYRKDFSYMLDQRQSRRILRELSGKSMSPWPATSRNMQLAHPPIKRLEVEVDELLYTEDLEDEDGITFGKLADHLATTRPWNGQDVMKFQLFGKIFLYQYSNRNGLSIPRLQVIMASYSQADSSGFHTHWL